MSNRTKPYDFESLAKMDNGRLSLIMGEGAKPTLQDLVGYDFRGFNLQSLTKFIGTRKFKKGFYGDPDSGHIWGYNIRVVQGKLSDPWISLPNNEVPKRLAFFKVFPADASGRHSEYPSSLVVDYSQWEDYFFLNPTRYILDYLVHPDPNNRDLLVGISFFAIGSFRTFAGYFILERYNKSDFSLAA
jgi:hypothetical protein